MKKSIGILVMGQSPRPEITAQFQRLLPDVTLVQRGCLDGLSREAIDGLAPVGDETTLFTRLPDGSAVKLSKAAVISHGEAQLDALEKAGTTLTIVLCTGDFPAWQGRNLLLPSNILRHFVMAAKPSGHIAVLSPLPAQTKAAQDRWQSLGYTTTNIALSPNASEAEAILVGEELAQDASDLIVFDCASYTQTTKQALCQAARKPGILALSCIARTTAELLDV